MSDTRDPILIFKEIEDVEDKQRLLELHKILEELRNVLPKDYSIGTAVSNGDCFFDSMAQALNELKTKTLVTCDKLLDVNTLRNNCANYAAKYKDKILKDSERGGYFIALKGPCGPVQCQETKKDIRDDNETFKAYLKKITNTSKESGRQLSDVIWGRPEIEGEMICEKYGVKMEVLELTEEKPGDSRVTKNEIGTGNIVIYVINYRNHFVPLLVDIKNDVDRRKSDHRGDHLSEGMRNVSESEEQQEANVKQYSKDLRKIRMSNNDTNQPESSNANGDIERSFVDNYFECNTSQDSDIYTESGDEQESEKLSEEDKLLMFRQLSSGICKNKTKKKKSRFLLHCPKKGKVKPDNFIASSYTRHPIVILKEIQCTKDETNLIELKEILNELKASLPEGYKMGVAIKNGDCFFDCIAQELNELKEKITSVKPINVITLREDCVNYAKNYKDKIIKCAERGAYFTALQGPYGPIQCLETKQDIRDDNKTFKTYLEKVKLTSAELLDAIEGRPEIEGEIICDKYGVKLKVIDIMKEKVGGSHIAVNEIGSGSIAMYVIKYSNHFVPLLRDIKEDVERSEDVSSKEIYGALSHVSRYLLDDFLDYFENKRNIHIKKQIQDKNTEGQQEKDERVRMQNTDRTEEQLETDERVRMQIPDRTEEQQETDSIIRQMPDKEMEQQDTDLRERSQVLNRETDEQWDPAMPYDKKEQASCDLVSKKKKMCVGDDINQQGPSIGNQKTESILSFDSGRSLNHVNKCSSVQSESKKKQKSRKLSEEKKIA